MNKKIESQIKKAKAALIEFIVPKTMTPRERVEFAKRANLNPETLKSMVGKGTMHADTLLRGLIARGVSVETIANLPQTNSEMLSKGEKTWLELGRELDEQERIEFSGLVRYIRSKWSIP